MAWDSLPEHVVLAMHQPPNVYKASSKKTTTPVIVAANHNSLLAERKEILAKTMEANDVARLAEISFQLQNMMAVEKRSERPPKDTKNIKQYIQAYKESLDKHQQDVLREREDMHLFGKFLTQKHKPQPVEDGEVLEVTVKN